MLFQFDYYPEQFHKAVIYEKINLYFAVDYAFNNRKAGYGRKLERILF